MPRLERDDGFLSYPGPFSYLAAPLSPHHQFARTGQSHAPSPLSRGFRLSFCRRFISHHRSRLAPLAAHLNFNPNRYTTRNITSFQSACKQYIIYLRQSASINLPTNNGQVERAKTFRKEGWILPIL